MSNKKLITRIQYVLIFLFKLFVALSWSN